MTTGPILLDEHVGRIFERLLAERGYEVEQSTDAREEDDIVDECHGSDEPLPLAEDPSAQS